MAKSHEASSFQFIYIEDICIYSVVVVVANKPLTKANKQQQQQLLPAPADSSLSLQPANIWPALVFLVRFGSFG